MRKSIGPLFLLGYDLAGRYHENNALFLEICFPKRVDEFIKKEGPDCQYHQKLSFSL